MAKAAGKKKAKKTVAKKKKKVAARTPVKKAAPQKKKKKVVTQKKAKAAPAKKTKAAPKKPKPVAPVVKKIVPPKPAPVIAAPVAQPRKPVVTSVVSIAAVEAVKPRIVERTVARLAVPPADYQPSGAELSNVRPALKQIMDDIINGMTITEPDVIPLLTQFANAEPTPMEAWLLWRSLEANTDQFTGSAAREVRRTLTALGVGE